MLELIGMNPSLITSSKTFDHWSKKLGLSHISSFDWLDAHLEFTRLLYGLMPSRKNKNEFPASSRKDN